MGGEAPIAHPSEWPVVRLGEIALKIGSGATPTGGEEAYLPQRTRFALVRSQNVFDRFFKRDGLAFISDEQAERLKGVALMEGDLLLNITGDGITFSRSCAVPKDILPACVNQHVAIIRVDPSLADSGYVLAYLTHPSVKYYIESFNSGGSRRAITKGHIESFRLPLPPLQEQHAIATLLDALDDKIELNRRTAETLEMMASALFKSWFVDFDPVRAKVEGRPSNLPNDIGTLFPNAIDELPKGWTTEGLAHHFSVVMGQSPPGDTYNSDGLGLPFYQGRTDFSFRFPERRIYCTAPTRKAQHGDTLVSVRAPVGDINMAGEECCIGRGVAAVRHESGSSSFTYYAMGTLQPKLMAFESEGTVFGAINKAQMEALEVLAPSQEVVKAFDAVASPLDQRIEGLLKQNGVLSALRDTLVPRLISGELRIRDAESEIEAA